MSRPRKRKRVCNLPKYNVFGPINRRDETNQKIEMTIEQYETIRLIDLELLDQEECAEIMGVARSTVQRIYNEGKGKIADSLVNGKILNIEGGDYEVCDVNNQDCTPCFGRGRRFRNGRNDRLKD